MQPHWKGDCHLSNPLLAKPVHGYAGAMLATALSLMMLAVVALTIGAIYLLRRGGARQQALLMLALAVILAVNVGIWTLPDGKGQAPAAQAR